MTNDERKILVEVSQEEYERIKVGALEKEIPTFESVKQSFIENMSDEDAKALLENHAGVLLDNVSDDALIGQIIKRTRKRSSSPVEPKRYEDAMSNKVFMRIKGTLTNLEQTDYSQFGNPTVVTQNKFEWLLELDQGENL